MRVNERGQKQMDNEKGHLVYDNKLFKKPSEDRDWR